MPTLYKPKKSYTLKYKKHDKQGQIQKIYNSSIWQKLRNCYLIEHPLCEVCESEGRIVPAVEIHHIREISNGESLEEMMDIAYNPNNLQALCIECHHKIHTYRRRQNKNATK